MDMSVARVTRVFRTYQGQAKMAELNKKSSFRTVQGQVDVVQISDEAKKKLASMQSSRKDVAVNPTT